MPMLVAPSAFAIFETSGATYQSDAGGNIFATAVTDVQDLIAAGCVPITALPTTAPAEHGVLWNNNGTLSIS